MHLRTSLLLLPLTLLSIPDDPRRPFAEPAGALTITADSLPQTVAANSSSNTVTFHLANTGTSRRVRFSCQALGNVTCGKVERASYWFGPDEQLNVGVTYAAGAAGSGTISLVATGDASARGSAAIAIQGKSSGSLPSGDGGVRPMAQQCGTTPSNPCRPNITVVGLDGPVERATETGPHSDLIRIYNYSDVEGFYEISCSSPSTQLSCSVSVQGFTLAPQGAFQAVVVTYSVLGIGVYPYNLDISAEPGDAPGITYVGPAIPVNVSGGPVSVVGTPMVTHLMPIAGTAVKLSDSLLASFFHPSGFNAATWNVKIDGLTRSVHLGGTSYTSDPLSSLGVTIPGTHTWSTYVCANNGRCETTESTFDYYGPPATYNLDDSLPAPVGAPVITGLLPGALPLPPSDSRGCPVSADAPEIRLVNPTSYLSQPANPSGLIFLAVGNSSNTLRVITNTVDFPAAQNKTCATSYTYLDYTQFDWNFWTATPTSNGELWNSYPYGDRAGAGCAWNGSCGGGLRAGPAPLDPTVSARAAPRAAHGSASEAPVPYQGGQGGPGASIVSAGAIHPGTYKLWINGTLLVNDGVPVSGTGVTTTQLQLCCQEFAVPMTLLNRYNPLNPTANNGGWNQIVAQISDSTGHSSKVQTRFVQLDAGNPLPISYTSMRDFTTRDESQCAAFGPFQCDGLVLSQTIPGFVTRDKDRSLHLLYRSASQRGRTILPFRMFLNPFQAAPDYIHTRTKIGAVWADDSLRYAGLLGDIGSGSGSANLNEAAEERRAIAAELPAPVWGDSIRRVTTAFTARYFTTTGNPQVVTDTVSQDVVSLTLLDTTQTRFGAGWQLAELNRLITGQSINGNPAAVWVLGDGSFTVFQRVGSVWTSPAGETARLYDSLSPPPGWTLGARWVIRLDNGGSLGFRPDGQPKWTKDLIGNATTFDYSSTSANARLVGITDPSGVNYQFQYNGDAQAGTRGFITDVVIRSGGTSLATVASLKYGLTSGAYDYRRLRALYLFDSTATYDSTRFVYDSSTAGAFIKRVEDPRSTASLPIVTNFTWDQALWRPTGVQRPAAKAGETGAWTVYRDPWRRIAPRVGRGRKPGEPYDRLLYDVQVLGTHVDFAGVPTDVQVDRFGHPTYVHTFSPPAVYAGGFLWKQSSGDDIRRIERDSLGRAIKVVGGLYQPSTADSVMYRYDLYNRVDRVIRTTLQWPIKSNAGGYPVTLDTLTFAYDSVVFWDYRRCSRVLWSAGPTAFDTTRMVYAAPGSGNSECVPGQIIGNARDTTIFTYDFSGYAAGRPVQVRDPNGQLQAVTYQSSHWNTGTTARLADNAVSTAYYNGFGRVDSIIDPVGIRTALQYDLQGRVTHQRTGKGARAPVTRTLYDQGGLAVQVDVYASNPESLDSPFGTIQTTKNYFDGLGRLDSTASPGIRSGSNKQGRLQSYTLKDAFGTPVWTYPGNGTYQNRFSDWRGRLSYLFNGPVSTFAGVGGEPFADAATKTFYEGLGLGTGKHLSNGQRFSFRYDHRGHLIYQDALELYGSTYTGSDTMAYSPVGQLLWEQRKFNDSLRVTRSYQYNRRGQRILAADTVVRLPSGSALSEGYGRTTYAYSDTTGRLTSVEAVVDGPGSPVNIGRVTYLYDRGGRVIQKNVKLGSGATWAAGDIITATSYRATGQLDTVKTYNGSGLPASTWYRFWQAGYNKVDDLLGYYATEPGFGSVRAYEMSYDTTYGTRRLLRVSRAAGPTKIDTYGYDVFGNRVSEDFNSGASGDNKSDGTFACPVHDTLLYGSDNRITKKRRSGCNNSYTYLTDQAGNRLAQVDTLDSAAQPTERYTYTAGNQLYYSLTRTGSIGSYDANWHWYDGTGRRIVSEVQTVNTWNPSLAPWSGVRTFYFYDGDDVGLTVTRASNGQWSVRQRFMTGGLDQQLAVRTSGSNLALVGDRSGTTLISVRPDGTQEVTAAYWSRDAFGNLDQLTGSGSSINTETGYTGASAPNQTGGFTYLRNRWYDPKTGRFLTQDPIGLAGGVNLYAYAGNNPIAFDDPFGLCDPPGTCTQSDVGPVRGRFAQLRSALENVLEKLKADGPIRPKTATSKFGNRNKTRGDDDRGYRQDPPHDPGKGGDAEGGDEEHISWWDYTQGKRKTGRGVKGHEPIKYAGCADTDVNCVEPSRNPLMPGFVVTPAPVFTVPGGISFPVLSGVPVFAIP